VNPPYLVHHFLTRAAQERPEQPFLVSEGEKTAYGDVEATSNRLARALLTSGLARGDRVGLLARNSRFYVEGYYAILKAGGIAVPLNVGDDAAALARSLRGCEARMLIAAPRLEGAASEAIAVGTSLELLALQTGERIPPGLSGVRVLSCHDACAAESAEPPASPPLTDLDVASIIFTSGSTGTPLGATLSHLNIVSNTRSIVEYLHLTRAERMLAILPFHYVYGKSLLNTHAAAGGTVVIENRFLYPNTALDTLENEECTGLAGVPSTFAILVNRSNLAERELPHFRYVTQAGGPMSPELTRRLMEALPGKRIFVMYGATEASARLSYLDPDELPRKIGSIGKAIPNVELRVLREDGTEADVGEMGEIVARGSNMTSGYWGDPEATAEVFDEHGYHTGDLARRDEEGFLYVVGRKRDFIKSGAHRISGLEIEHAILELPQIHEVAVIGVPDEILGEKIKAFVVFREGCEADLEALEKTLKRKLAYKAPAEIEVRNDLPKSPAGKIMKQALR
jgi:acyl-CoA synthetase (AMP-forming)/AMP-acid ligase II